MRTSSITLVTVMIAGSALGQVITPDRRPTSPEVYQDSWLERSGLAPKVTKLYDGMFQDLLHAYWNDETSSPTHLSHILPTDGSGGATTGLIINDARAFSFWQMCQYANVLYWDWKINHSEDTRRKIFQQWEYVRAIFTDRQLSTGWLGHMINASDDAGWEANYLVQVSEVTGDRRALADAAALIPSVLAYFADPTLGTAVTYGPGVVGSKYGLLYVTPSQGEAYRSFGVISTAYETSLALAALSVYNATGNKALLNYVEGTWSWQHHYLVTTAANEQGLTKPALGLIYAELDIGSRAKDGHPNPHYLQPLHNNFGASQQGLSAEFIGGTMAMAVLSQRLYAVTRNPTYSIEAADLIVAMTASNGYVTEQGLLLNDRDPWTDGYWAPAFADEVLSQAQSPAASRLSSAFRSTALNVVAQRTPTGHYGGNWSGPPGGISVRNVLGFSTYEAQASSANSGKGGGQATSDQIMTSSSSASLVQAAVMIEARFAGRR